MKNPISMLVRRPLSLEESEFILACDMSVLHWLARSFRRLKSGHPFRIGDGHPVGSDNHFLIEIGPTWEKQALDLALSSGHLRWVVSGEEADRFAALIDGMIECDGACHQYLEGFWPKDQILIVSKGEYDIDTLRPMRE